MLFHSLSHPTSSFCLFAIYGNRFAKIRLNMCISMCMSILLTACVRNVKGNC